MLLKAYIKAAPEGTKRNPPIIDNNHRPKVALNY